MEVLRFLCFSFFPQQDTAPLQKTIWHWSNQVSLSKQILSSIDLHVEMAETLHQFSFCEAGFCDAI